DCSLCETSNRLQMCICKRRLWGTFRWRWKGDCPRDKYMPELVRRMEVFTVGVGYLRAQRNLRPLEIGSAAEWRRHRNEPSKIRITLRPKIIATSSVPKSIITSPPLAASGAGRRQ